jgi:hypothetical protein
MGDPRRIHRPNLRVLSRSGHRHSHPPNRRAYHRSGERPETAGSIWRDPVAAPWHLVSAFGPQSGKGGNAVYVTPWVVAALVVAGAVSGVFGYVMWSSRDTHSDHSHHDAATTVRAVRSRVLGDRWAKRYRYSPLAPHEPLEDQTPSRARQNPFPRRGQRTRRRWRGANNRFLAWKLIRALPQHREAASEGRESR